MTWHKYISCFGVFATPSPADAADDDDSVDAEHAHPPAEDDAYDADERDGWRGGGRHGAGIKLTNYINITI